ncbi:hypothetical protein FocTR4_00010830 [Fusarium oxysporum f. sp. cubense]|uniref:Nephrocystin 3-like N-terminal domain-containing protein n=1 Tax=Fusarium oxysporum f. sp. cubense TaxID=61366 RepID=A0A5C6T7G2_FUSOC|nr:hypothetical protein FocTR4_00010830 [Fusarium oxysporum f. sp. cubense]
MTDVQQHVMRNSYLNRTLCICGMKACGKSVLIKSIAQKLGEQCQINLHFSFWSGNENQRKLEDLLRTLVWQISRRIKETDLEKVFKLLTRSKGIDKRSLVEAIHVALSGISQKVYCTIDGIDESSKDWNSDTDGCLSISGPLQGSHKTLSAPSWSRGLSANASQERCAKAADYRTSHKRGYRQENCS